MQPGHPGQRRQIVDLCAGESQIRNVWEILGAEPHDGLVQRLGDGAAQASGHVHEPGFRRGRGGRRGRLTGGWCRRRLRLNGGCGRGVGRLRVVIVGSDRGGGGDIGGKGDAEQVPELWLIEKGVRLSGVGVSGKARPQLLECLRRLVVRRGCGPLTRRPLLVCGDFLRRFAIAAGSEAGVKLDEPGPPDEECEGLVVAEEGGGVGDELAQDALDEVDLAPLGETLLLTPGDGIVSSGGGAAHQRAVEQAFDLAGVAFGELRDPVLDDLSVALFPLSEAFRPVAVRRAIEGFDLAGEEVPHLPLAGGDVHFDLEHLVEVALSFGLSQAVDFVMLFDHGFDHLAVEADHEDELGDVEIELEGFEHFEDHLGQAAVEVVDEDDHALVVGERGFDPLAQGGLELVEKRFFGMGGLSVVLGDLGEGVEVHLGFDARFLDADGELGTGEDVEERATQEEAELASGADHGFQ